MATSASIIIASRDEGIRLKQTLDSIINASGRIPYEIIVVDDGSTDNSVPDSILSSGPPVQVIRTPGMGVAPARNAGARIAQGDMLIFCDAHITVPDYWLDILGSVIENEKCDAVTPGIGPLEPSAFVPLYRLAASAPIYSIGCGRIFRTLISNTWLHEHTRPIDCPILSGGCFAVRHEVWRRIGGYEESFRGYGYDEEEISLKLWLFGYRLMTVPSVIIHHKFRPAAPYQIVNSDMLHNRMFAALCHFNDERTTRMLDHLESYPEFQMISQQVFTPANYENKRKHYFSRRKYDDDWYFRKFDLSL